MVKFSDKGSGWHKEGTRHSRAKKYGTAGGNYHVPTRSKKLRKLTYSQLKKKGVKLSANGDADHDGVRNSKDCRPFNPKMQDVETRTYKVYDFDSLPPEAKQKALDKHRDINVDHNWWEQDGLLDLTEKEMKDIGVKMSKKWYESKKPKDSAGNIKGEYPAHTGLIHYKFEDFDLDRDNYLHFENITVQDTEIFRKFLRISPMTWQKTDFSFNNEREKDTELVLESLESPYEDYPSEAKEIERAKEIWADKMKEAKANLRSQCEDNMSDEQIIETFRANEYKFTEDGDID